MKLFSLYYFQSQFNNRLPAGSPRGMRLQQQSSMDFPGNPPNPPPNNNTSNSNINPAINIDANRSIFDIYNITQFILQF